MELGHSVQPNVQAQYIDNQMKLHNFYTFNEDARQELRKRLLSRTRAKKTIIWFDKMPTKEEAEEVQRQIVETLNENGIEVESSEVTYEKGYAFPNDIEIYRSVLQINKDLSVISFPNVAAKKWYHYAVYKKQKARATHDFQDLLHRLRVFLGLKELKENYHPGKEIAVRHATTKEKDAFVARMNEIGLQPDQSDLNDIVDMCDDVVGAFEGNVMLGAMALEDHFEHTEICVMLVDPERRKEGIGKMLVQYAEDNSKKDHLTAHPHTDDAENFYKKLGFEVDEDFDESDPNTVVKALNVKENLFQPKRLQDREARMAAEELQRKKLVDQFMEEWPTVEMYRLTDSLFGYCKNYSFGNSMFALNEQVKVVSVQRVDDTSGEVVIEVEMEHADFKDGHPQYAIDLLDFVQNSEPA